MQGMQGGASGWETACCQPFPTCTPWEHCPHGPAQIFESAPLHVHRDLCVHAHGFKPLTTQGISLGSESTQSPHTCTPRGCTHGKGASPYLFCGNSAQHSGVANTKLQGKDMERSWAA